VDGTHAFVVEAELALDDDCDPAAVGAAVTTGLCGERRLPESNRCKRLCRPLRSHSAKAPAGQA
jgi:hypothetical protein